MKKIIPSLLLALIGGTFLTGCVAIPPLINVEHKESSSSETQKKLDAIERRLERLEDKLEKKQ